MGCLHVWFESITLCFLDSDFLHSYVLLIEDYMREHSSNIFLPPPPQQNMPRFENLESLDKNEFSEFPNDLRPTEFAKNEQFFFDLNCRSWKNNNLLYIFLFFLKVLFAYMFLGILGNCICLWKRIISIQN